VNLADITQRLIADEDEVLHVYPDHLGFATIGVGRLVDPRKGGGITQEESRYLLRNDIARRIAECEQRFEWWGLLDPVTLCPLQRDGYGGDITAGDGARRAVDGGEGLA
jgi:hypothetical protein